MLWGVAALGCTVGIWPMVGMRAGARVPNGNAKLKDTVGGMSGGGVVVLGVVLVPECGVASAANSGSRFLAICLIADKGISAVNL